MVVAGMAALEAAVRIQTDVVAYAAAWRLEEVDAGVGVVGKGSLVGVAVMATSRRIYRYVR
jgi:hypothetical protein